MNNFIRIKSLVKRFRFIPMSLNQNFRSKVYAETLNFIEDFPMPKKIYAMSEVYQFLKH